MPVEEKDTKPTVAAAKKTEPKASAKAVDPIVADLKDMGPVADLIRGSNIAVVLRIGNEGSPSYREVQMKHLAREIKAKV